VKDPSVYARKNRARDAVESGAILAALSAAALREHFDLLLADPVLGRARRSPEQLSLELHSGERGVFGIRASLMTAQRKIPFEVASHFDASHARRFLDVLWQLGVDHRFQPSTTRVDMQHRGTVSPTRAWEPLAPVLGGLVVTRFDLSSGPGQIERGALEPASAGLVVELRAPDAGSIRLYVGPVLGDAVGAFVSDARALERMLRCAPP
jgi:hypothetical protein